MYWHWQPVQGKTDWGTKGLNELVRRERSATHRSAQSGLARTCCIIRKGHAALRAGRHWQQWQTLLAGTLALAQQRGARGVKATEPYHQAISWPTGDALSDVYHLASRLSTKEDTSDSRWMLPRHCLPCTNPHSTAGNCSYCVPPGQVPITRGPTASATAPLYTVGDASPVLQRKNNLLTFQKYPQRS